MRLEKLDIFRGIAIVLMVLFHFNYSLVYTFDIGFLNFSDTFWFIVGKISVILFILIAGISFCLAEKKYSNNITKKYLKISTILAIFACSITIITYLLNNEFYIRFGILHYFSLSFLFMLFFRRLGYYNVILGIIIIIYGVYFIPIIQNTHLFFLGFMYPGFTSSDYYPIIPYFGIMLLGYSFALYLNDIDKLNIFKLKNHKNILEKILEYLGKKSFIIYLIHQPIIVCLIFLIILLF
ncbi:MAG: heparan-alpha-glucosaminide N-acetyltransferase [Candidatus Gracilibacteria bacterium]|nr:heparan-alpha-glucosaminide N-acetyltransferase [Candidatus Gracilibacteria bacterium]